MSIPALQPPPPPGLRLLVAEDNDIVRRVFVTWARREQVAVDEARDGAEALQVWNNALLAFDILITDHAMPGMNGVELVRRIREHGTQAARQLRVIVFSGYLTDEETNAYRALGVSRFLQKPCLPQRLIAAIFQPDDSNGVYSPHS